MTTWQERFAEQFCDTTKVVNGYVPQLSATQRKAIAEFISEERNAVARDVLERIAKAFANVETDDQIMFIAKFAVELQKLGEEYSI